MEPMRKCEACGQWIRSFSRNDCTCTPQKTYYSPDEILGAEADGLFKDRPAVNEPKKQGIKVQFYKPNRAQKRKQAALKRKGKLIK